jgi:hypothetical protein
VVAAAPKILQVVVAVVVSFIMGLIQLHQETHIRLQ